MLGASPTPALEERLCNEAESARASWIIDQQGGERKWPLGNVEFRILGLDIKWVVWEPIWVYFWGKSVIIMLVVKQPIWVLLSSPWDCYSCNWASLRLLQFEISTSESGLSISLKKWPRRFYQFWIILGCFESCLSMFECCVSMFEAFWLFFEVTNTQNVAFP